jgi:hypothetical protein
MSKPKTKKPLKRKTRSGKILSKPFYGYLQPINLIHAQAHVKSHGSVSAYLNALICKERGVTPPSGLRNAPTIKKRKKAAKRALKKTATPKPAAASPSTQAQV